MKFLQNDTNKQNQIKMKYGGYAIFTSLMFVAMMLVANLIIQKLNLTIDFTEERVFSLSKQSLQVIDGLEEEITILALNKSGSEETTITRILNEYDKKSKYISVEYVDPELHPNIVSTYQEGNQSLAYGSVIVTNENKFKVINSIDMYTYDSNQSKIEAVQVEPKITNSISYVTGGHETTIYTLVGHDELPLPDSLIQTLEMENYQIQELNLIRDEWDPQENDVVLLNGLKKDLTKEESQKLCDYLANEGKLLLFDNLVDTPFKNLEELIQTYGLSVRKAMVFENDKNHTITAKNIYLVPKFTSHEIVKELESANYSVITVYGQPIEILNVKKDTLTIEALMQSSDQSYGKTVEKMKTSTSTEEDAGDLKGPFDLAVAVTDEKGNAEDNSKVVLFSSSYILDDSLIEASNNANIDMVVNSINWLSDRKESISIRPKDVSSDILTMNQSQQIYISILAIIAMPLLIAAIGAITWYRRKNK